MQMKIADTIGKLEDGGIVGTKSSIGEALTQR